jgi:hypothetical protein
MGVAASFQMASNDPSLLYLYSVSPLPPLYQGWTM